MRFQRILEKGKKKKKKVDVFLKMPKLKEEMEPIRFSYGKKRVFVSPRIDFARLKDEI